MEVWTEDVFFRLDNLVWSCERSYGHNQGERRHRSSGREWRPGYNDGVAGWGERAGAIGGVVWFPFDMQ